MTKYLVNLSAAPLGHEVPALLAKFGAWVAEQDHGTLGAFDGLVAEPIPTEWSPTKAERLRREGFTFLGLPDGSLVALIRPGAMTRSAVALLGSEGEARTVANSLEEFLSLWAQGETGLDELDAADTSGRKALVAWLKQHKLKVPKGEDFDFATWLEGDAPLATGAEAAPRFTPTEVLARLGPKTQRLAAVLGRRADAPEVVAYVTEVLGKKVPRSTSENTDSVNVSAPKQGVELVFSHDVLNDAFPPQPKTAKTFIPYVSTAWVRAAVGEPLLGVPWKATSEEEVARVLGPPTGRRAAFATEDALTVAFWTWALDTAGHLELELEFDDGITVTLSVRSARALERYPDITTGLFVGYAATRGLLVPERFPAHQELLSAVARREVQGSRFVKQALPRGLWDDHLRDAPGLRSLAYRWFHNMKGLWLTEDLKAVFGSRRGAFGHDEPVLDDDTWDAVDKAAPVLDQRLGAWLGSVPR
ncbi:hypothetical protein DRW03_04270 [Corallococcus sp. H22C18031201]|uniref:hypothetical protein n=1 Tax=Citreicoccus inhibens TaxID=2849499 RepID=UPI000E71C7AF|nr:hypothetical protein [Citreicoccus inhibens]MBU8899217.1 hypothetical protein [Citreicoccus inhibens]RJS25705.1 hypothetical protein DRW03_04270 [Corallococcus sp. H22C18031201]